jgi:hypothetical protein
VGTVAGRFDLPYVTVTTFAVAQRGEQFTLSSRRQVQASAWDIGV